LIRNHSKIPGRTVDVDPVVVCDELGMGRREYERRIVSLSDSGYLIVYTGLIAGITYKGLDVLMH